LFHYKRWKVSKISKKNWGQHFRDSDFFIRSVAKQYQTNFSKKIYFVNFHFIFSTKRKYIISTNFFSLLIDRSSEIDREFYIFWEFSFVRNFHFSKQYSGRICLPSIIQISWIMSKKSAKNWRALQNFYIFFFEIFKI